MGPNCDPRAFFFFSFESQVKLRESCNFYSWEAFVSSGEIIILH